MRIAQVVCRFKPYKGGISNVAYEYAQGLADLGHEVTVFTPLYDKKDNETQFDKFAVKRLQPIFHFGNSGFLPQLFQGLKGFDLVNLHYPFFGGAEVVWLLKKRLGGKIKLVVNYQMDVVGSGLKKCIFDFHTRFIMPRIIAAADRVIISSFDYAENSNVKKLLAKYPEKFTAIPPGADLSRFSPQAKDPDLLKRFGLKPEDKILLFVGALDKAHYFKGIHFLIDSYKDFDLDNLKIMIVGDGDMKPEYQKHVLGLGLIDSILFAGSAAENDLAKYYNLADAIILPSIDKSEAFGIVLVEAMACAKPVITADLAGVRSVYENNISGFSFKVLDKDDLEQKVRKLFQDDDLRTKMGFAARARAEKMYAQDTLIKKLEEIYVDLWR